MNKVRLKLMMSLFSISSFYNMQAADSKQDSRPNIIFIMSDDHARQAISIYGHPIGKVAPTPNITPVRDNRVFYTI